MPQGYMRHGLPEGAGSTPGAEQGHHTPEGLEQEAPSTPVTPAFSSAPRPCLCELHAHLFPPSSSSILVPGTALQWLESWLLSHSKTVVWIHKVTSSAIAAGEVSSLDHEVLDHTVELAAFEAKSFLEVWRENME